jgi:nucleoside-diphosphate-sugar epimerase
MIIAITGSKGFIGSKLTQRLSLNHHILEIDSSDDITNPKIFKKSIKFDFLIHLAAKSYVPKSYENPLDFYRVNMIGTLNALELCRINNAKMIFFSSYVYGQPDYLPIDELHKVESFNPYSQSKLIGEALCKSYYRDFNVPSIIFRPFNIYGLNQNPNFLLPTIIKMFNEGAVSLNDPRPKRDFIYVDDIINAVLCALQNPFENFEIYNLGSGISFSVDEIVNKINRLHDNNFQISYKNEYRKNEVLDTIADISKAKRLLNWEPMVSIDEGLSKLVNN